MPRKLAALVVVIAATFAGGSVGIGVLGGHDADRGFAAASAPQRILVEARGFIRTDDPAFTAAVADLAARLRAVPHAQVESPLTNGNERLMAADGHSAMVELEIAGDGERDRSAALDAIAAAQRAHPAFRIEVTDGKALEDHFHSARALPSRARW